MSRLQVSKSMTIAPTTFSLLVIAESVALDPDEITGPLKAALFATSAVLPLAAMQWHTLATRGQVDPAKGNTRRVICSLLLLCLFFAQIVLILAHFDLLMAVIGITFLGIALFGFGTGDTTSDTAHE